MSVLFRRAALLAVVAFSCLLLFVASCDDPQADAPVDSITEPAATTSDVPSGTADAAPTPRPTADWPEYTAADGRITFRYPPDWHRRGGAIYSFDPDAVPGLTEGLPLDAVKVELSVDYLSRSRFCGGASFDESGEIVAIDPEATETVFAGRPGLELVRDRPDPPSTLIRALSLMHEGFCIRLVAYFTQEMPDERTFAQIAESFEIRDFTPIGPNAYIDWATYTDSEGRLSFRYPSDWYVRNGAVYSFDPGQAGVASEALPPHAVKVEAQVLSPEGRTSCGPLNFGNGGIVLSVEPKVVLSSLHPDAQATVLGGEDAWELHTIDPAPPLTGTHEITLVHEGDCVSLIAHFTQDIEDEPVFELIAESFDFISQTAEVK